MVLEWFSVLAGEFGQAAALVVAVLYGGYKFRRIKTIIGGIVGAIGTFATIGAVVIGAIVLGSATGWVSVDLGQAVSDLSSGAGTAWDVAGRQLFEWVTQEVMG